MAACRLHPTSCSWLVKGHFVALQVTTIAVEEGEAAAEMLLLVATGVMGVTIMATMLMEGTITRATTVEMVALPEATMATVAMVGMLLVVSLFMEKIRALLGDDQLALAT